MNKKSIKWLFLSAMVVTLMACPYKSRVPIGPVEEKVDKDLTGFWIKTKDADKENPEYFEIKKYDKMEYEIDKWSYSSYDSAYSMERYISHINTIETNKFLNMQKNGTGDYYLYKIEYNDKDLTLFELTDNIDETFNTSAQLKDFVKANMNLSFFYNKDEVGYTKKAKEGDPNPFIKK